MPNVVRLGRRRSAMGQPFPTPLLISSYQAGAVHTQHSLDSWGDPTAVASGKALLASATDAENQHIMGFGTTSPSVANGSRDYVGNGLSGRVNTVMAGASRKVITFALAPAWMRDTAGQTPIDDFTPQAWFHAPPDPTHVADFASLCADIASTFTGVQHFLVWNEMKGLFDSVLNRWDYARYTTIYNAVYTAVKTARPDALIGGPYINLGSNIGPGSPVQDPAWGYVDQRLLDVMTYWLANKTGADFITVDGGNYTASGTSPTPFGKYRRFMEWLRGLNNTTYPGATTLPVWIAEHYCYPPGASAIDPANTTDKPRYPPEWAVGTIEAIRAGYATCMLWGPQGFDGDADGFSYPMGLFTDTQVVGGGQATTLYPVVKTMHDNYSAGTPIYIPQTGNANIASIANPTTCTLINRDSGSQSTSGFVGAADQTLTGYEVRTIPWSPVGYQEQADTVMGTRWTDTFTTTADLNTRRGSVTAVAGKLRGGGTSVANMAASAAEYDTTDHYGQIVVSTLTGSSSEVGVGLRFNTTTGEYYLALVNGGGAGEIYYFDGASYHLLNSTSGLTVTGLPKTLRGEVQGTALRLYWNGSVVVSTTDSTLTLGQPTTYEYPTSSVANVELDSWQADLL